MANTTFWVRDFIEDVPTRFSRQKGGAGQTLVLVSAERDAPESEARKFFTGSTDILYVLQQVRDRDAFPRRSTSGRDCPSATTRRPSRRGLDGCGTATAATLKEKPSKPNIMRTSSVNEPVAIDIQAHGDCLYHWDIEKVTEQEEEGRESVHYECNEVRVYAPITRDKILAAAIKSLWDTDREQKLVNEYNAQALGIGDESAIEAYRTFLTERARLKAQVASDCAAAGID